MTLLLGLDELCENYRSELKQNYVAQHFQNPSWLDLANADTLVTDEMLEQEYGDTSFSPDDFFSTPNEDETEKR